MDQQLRPRAMTLAALVVLAALTFLSLWSVWPPAPKGEDAPADQFSAARAFDHVETIGQEVHVAGSKAAGTVRQHIVDTLTGLGLSPEVHEGVGATGALGSTYGLAHVNNVVAVIPGTDSTGRVFMVAHYDSVQVSYGANDDGAGTSTLLETARALTQGEPLRNDIVLVFTDAEEACLCGAEAFVHDDPLAADGGVVLNFEARGASGPAIMFETSRGNAALVDEYAQVPYPVGSSMAVEVYRILPNDTDFTPFREQDRFTGLNSAYIDGSAVYHSPEDRPEYMDKASLQHHGSNALALARSFGNGDVAELAQPSSGDATYFPAPGTLVRYPGWLVWPFAVAAVLAVAAFGVVAVRRGLVARRRLVAALLLGVVPIVAVAVLAQLLWLALVAIRPGYGEMIDPWRPWWFRAGLVLLVATVLLTWYTALRNRVGATALAVGALAWLALLGVVLAALTPGGSYLAALPALAGGLAGIVAVLVRSDTGGLVAHTVAGAIAVVVLAPIVLLFMPALGLATGAAPALFAVLLGMVLLPVLDGAIPRGRGRALPAVVAGAATVVCLGVGLVVDQFDARHPLPTQLMYALDADSGQAWWASQEIEPSTWTSQFVTGHEDLSAKFPMLTADEATGPAEAADLPAPVVGDVTRTGSAVSFTVTPKRAVRLVGLTASGVRTATVEGRDVPVTDGTFDVVFNAPPADGVHVTLTLATADPVEVRVTDGSDGLADLPGFRARPTGVGIEGSHTSELVLVGTTVTL
ncbi:M28 family peptidase [Cellulomonas rhizosphaerae]|nr:M28 family peptidase [Cellulomonas rhizosphaerae]